MKGWYGDKIQHSLASRGIKTVDNRNIIQYKQEPRVGLIYELDYELESMYANGKIMKALKSKTSKVKTKIKTKVSEVKRDFKSAKSSIKQTTSKWKRIGKAVGGVASMVGQDMAKMGKEMKDSGSMFMDIKVEKSKEAIPSASITALKKETTKIDNDIKTLDKKIKERRKEINIQERQDKKDFVEWYNVEKDAYELSKDSIQASSMDNDDLKYELRKQEIEFKASIEQNKHLLNSFRDVNDADIEFMRDLQYDLKRLRREVKKRVNRG